MLRSSSIVLLCLASMNVIAHAQPAGAPAPAPDPSTTPPAPAAVAPAPAPDGGGVTLRNGFSLSVGEEFATATMGSTTLSGQLYGVDWRIGAKITDALAVYLHSHLSFGTAKIGAASGVTGNFAAAIVGEYMLPQRFFVGAGGGWGVLNNPNGPLGEARVGWYPMSNTSVGKSRRLNVALDLRYYTHDDPSFTAVKQIALSLGYDRF